MIILTLNSGSTSVKLAVYDTAGGNAPTRIGSEHHSGSDIEPRQVLADFLQKLRSAPDVVAHRVVHGGTRFTAPVRIDEKVISEIHELSELAPLHNPKALEWIEAARAECGSEVVQVAVFDTSFFSGLPRKAAEYALPGRIGVDHGVRRYGFHGLAHEAMWRRWCELYPALRGGGRLITVQLGGGCSLTAHDHGRPVDNSMGFSPLEGLVMATRSGDVDPSILPYLQKRLGLSSEQLVGLLDTESGLVGLAGKLSAVFNGIAHQHHAGKTSIDIKTIDPHRMVVIPEGGSVLLHGIAAHAASTGQIPVLGISIVPGAVARAMQVHHSAHVRDAGAAAVKRVIDGEEMALGKKIHPLDFHRLVGAQLDHRRQRVRASGPVPAVAGGVAPQFRRRQIAMQRRHHFAHGNRNSALQGTDGLWQRQRIDKWRQLEGVQLRRRSYRRRVVPAGIAL